MKKNHKQSVLLKNNTEKKETTKLPTWSEFVKLAENETSQRATRVVNSHTVYGVYSKGC